ncbi:hypothetical protein BU17DRAFT_104244 [Hysterangium stoloniferum]|nr:hypothetical protein BU17DRAFT_104244 [Hysterangium stoloniferum]
MNTGPRLCSRQEVSHAKLYTTEGRNYIKYNAGKTQPADPVTGRTFFIWYYGVPQNPRKSQPCHAIPSPVPQKSAIPDSVGSSQHRPPGLDPATIREPRAPAQYLNTGRAGATHRAAAPCPTRRGAGSTRGSSTRSRCADEGATAWRTSFVPTQTIVITAAATASTVATTTENMLEMGRGLRVRFWYVKIVVVVVEIVPVAVVLADIVVATGATDVVVVVVVIAIADYDWQSTNGGIRS